MATYKRNELVERALASDPTLGLPLFQGPKKRISKRLQDAIENAPRSMPIATDTRGLAHLQTTFDPDILSKRELMVFNAFAELRLAGHQDATNEEIRVHLGTEINRVVGRTFSLRERGILGPSQKRKCRVTGNVVTAWQIVREYHQEKQ